MKKINLISFSLLAMVFVVSSCRKDNLSDQSKDKNENSKLSYKVEYTEQQLKNWESTGSPFLETELYNSSNTKIDPFIPSKGGVFKPIPPATKAFGVHPYQNRFWSMIRLKLAIQVITLDDYNLKNNVIQAISTIQSETNIRFYNSINDPVTDPVYGFTYPNVYIQKTSGAQIGSSYIGLKGGEQYIYLPANATVGFIIRALVNVAGMYNEQQRNDRDTYVNVNSGNIQPANSYHFNKITTNFYSIGVFDFNSITLSGSDEFSSNGLYSITQKNGAVISRNESLSDLDRRFLNYFYLPYTARTDTYRELASVVYDGNNVQLTESQRLDLQAALNNGNPYPPSGGQITPVNW